MESSPLQVKTLLRQNERSVPLEEFKGPIMDANYIEGALSAQIYGNELFDVTLWDYVDQLWAYLVDGICAVAKRESYSCYFPDQPILIEFQILGGNQVKIFVGAGVGRTEIIDIEEFLLVFGKAAMQFCSQMIELVPADSSTFTAYIAQLSKVIVVK